MLNEFKVWDNFFVREGVGYLDNNKYGDWLKMNLALELKEKYEVITKVKRLKYELDEVVEEITQKRVSWIVKYRGIVDKYSRLYLPEQTYRVIFFEHLNINPEYSQVIKSTRDFIIIRSYNFCPYLEVCKLLNLATRLVCQKVCEQPFNEMIKYIDLRLRFWRNYNYIRPGSEYCEEYIELR